MSGVADAGRPHRGQLPLAAPAALELRRQVRAPVHVDRDRERVVDGADRVVRVVAALAREEVRVGGGHGLVVRARAGDLVDVADERVVTREEQDHDVDEEADRGDQHQPGADLHDQPRAEVGQHAHERDDAQRDEEDRGVVIGREVRAPLGDGVVAGHAADDAERRRQRERRHEVAEDRHAEDPAHERADVAAEREPRRQHARVDRVVAPDARDGSTEQPERRPDEEAGEGGDRQRDVDVGAREQHDDRQEEHEPLPQRIAGREVEDDLLEQRDLPDEAGGRPREDRDLR